MSVFFVPILIAQSFANFGNITENGTLPPQSKRYLILKVRSHNIKKRKNQRMEGEKHWVVFNYLTGEKEDNIESAI